MSTLTLKCNSSSHQCLALVGEAPGPNGDARTPLWPEPSHMAGGRLASMLGYSRSEYLRTFKRANLLDRYPGPVFPLSRARAWAEQTAIDMAPLPLILLGRGVANAFRFPTQYLMCWEDYLLGSTLIRAAVIPHPSGRNLFYNDPAAKARVSDWLLDQVDAHQAK